MDKSSKKIDSIDDKAIEMIRSVGGNNLLNEMAEIFLQRVPQKIAKVKDALANKDWSEMAHLFHSLAGSSGSIGAMVMMEYLKAMEESAIQCNVDSIGKNIDELDQLFLDVKNRLNTIIRSDGNEEDCTR